MSPATKNHLGQNVLRIRNTDLHQLIPTRIYTNLYKKLKMKNEEAEHKHPNKKSRFPTQCSL